MAEFRYTQLLERSIRMFSSFVAGVSYISIVTNTFQLFNFGFAFGGLASLWSWPMVFAGQIMVALCFAELVARYLIARLIYSWSKRFSRLAGKVDDIHHVHCTDLGGRACRPDDAAADWRRLPWLGQWHQ
jgi:hypothetical protein